MGFEIGIFPNDWRHAMIVPLYKDTRGLNERITEA